MVLACRAENNSRAVRGVDRPPEPLHAVTVALQNETVMAASSPRFGFVSFAETWNGRLAMLGFVIGLGTELLTGQGILAQIGLS